MPLADDELLAVEVEDDVLAVDVVTGVELEPVTMTPLAVAVVPGVDELPTPTGTTAPELEPPPDGVTVTPLAEAGETNHTSRTTLTKRKSAKQAINVRRARPKICFTLFRSFCEIHVSNLGSF